MRSLQGLISSIRLWLKRPEKPEVIDREYIQGETPEEIGHISDTNYPDKAQRPIPYIPESHEPIADKAKRKSERKRKKAA